MSSLKKRYSLGFLILALLTLLFLFSTGFILYQFVFSYNNNNYVAIFFNLESDIPDSAARLKYPTSTETTDNITFADGVNRLEVGRNYTIIFSVKNNKSFEGRYYYFVKSNILNMSGFLDVAPSQIESVILNLNPSEDDKWVLKYTTRIEKVSIFDLSDNSWLGIPSSSSKLVIREGNSSAVIAVNKNINLEAISGKDSYTYIPIDENSLQRSVTQDSLLYNPIVLSVDSFGDVLNLNLSLSNLRIKPHTQTFYTFDSDEDKKTISTKNITLSVSNNQLIVNKVVSTKVFRTSPDTFIVYLFDKPINSLPIGVHEDLRYSSRLKEYEYYSSIGFWYIIK